MDRTPTTAGCWRWLIVAAASSAAVFLLAFGPAQAQEAPRQKTESPYFLVKSDDPALDALPLKATQVDVRIAGVIADVTVTQHYRNEGQRAIEAKYVFPGSTQAVPRMNSGSPLKSLMRVGTSNSSNSTFLVTVPSTLSRPRSLKMNCT